MSDAMLQKGRNCWKTPRSAKIGFLIDGENYFPAVADAIARAEHAVFILGWDINGDVHFRRGEGAPNSPENTLRGLINAALARHPGLDVYVLAWDFAMIYAFERELVPIFKLVWERHPRLHVVFDDEHPVAGSHHQKVVVVDDALAFVGGMDLTAHRWDSRAHHSSDSRRTSPAGDPYGPHHDLMIAVSGEAARAVGDLCRERWKWATGEAAKPPAERPPLWLPEMPVALSDVDVGLSRTLPAYKGRPEIREIENFYLDAIRAAKHTIYIENQYFSAYRIAQALAVRLNEESGPEIVMLVPDRASGWLGESTVGIRRAQLFEMLREADKGGRLQIYRAVAGDADRTRIYLHSKVLVVDDEILSVGSANLANRSMGLDTELNVAIEAGGDRSIQKAIRAFRDDLLAEHLALPLSEFAKRVDDEGGLGRAIEVSRGMGRSLVPFTGEVPTWLEELIPQTNLLDPERPLDVDSVLHEFVPSEARPPALRTALGNGLLRTSLWSVAALALWAIVRLTLVGEQIPWADLSVVSDDRLDQALTAAAVTGAIAAGAMLFVPVTLLYVAAGALLGTWIGFAAGAAGASIGALLGYVAGRLAGRGRIRRVMGKRLNRVSLRLSGNSLVGVVALRIVPLLPFASTNVVAGASRVRPSVFALGTLIGILPGALLFAAIGRWMERALDVGWMSALPVIVPLAAGLLGIAAAGWHLRTQGLALGAVERERAESSGSGPVKKVSESEGERA